MGFTERHRFQNTELMVQRMAKPSFTNQSDWEQRHQRWQASLARLLASNKPEALPPFLELYRREVGAHPGDLFLRGNFAQLLEAAKAEALALEQWKECLACRPNDLQANCSVGRLLDAHGQSEEALGYFDTALQRRPDFPEALNARGLCLVNLKKYPEAAGCYQKSVSINPDFVEGYVNLGLLYSRIGEANLALGQYKEALRVKPGCFPAHINLGNLYLTLGRLNEANSRSIGPLRHKTPTRRLLILTWPMHCSSWEEAPRLSINTKPLFVVTRIFWRRGSGWGSN